MLFVFSKAQRLLSSLWFKYVFAQREVNEKKMREQQDPFSTFSLAERLFISL